MKKTYFVGGPLDGREIETESDRYVVELREKPTADIYAIRDYSEALLSPKRFYYEIRSFSIDRGLTVRIGFPEGQSFSIEFLHMLERRATEAKKFQDELTEWRNCARRLAYLVKSEHGTDPGLRQYEELGTRARKMDVEEMIAS